MLSSDSYPVNPPENTDTPLRFLLAEFVVQQSESTAVVSSLPRILIAKKKCKRVRKYKDVENVGEHQLTIIKHLTTRVLDSRKLSCFRALQI